MTWAVVPTATIRPPASATASARIAWSFIVRIGPPDQIRSAVVYATDAVQLKQAAAKTMNLDARMSVVPPSRMLRRPVIIQRVTPDD
jgi:hypothetical protein